MKPSITKLAKTPLPPVFPTVVHTVKPTAASLDAKAKKRDNVFSKSKDTREDRSARQMKNAHSSQTQPHGK
jgi:hypothetical protein